MDEVDSKTQDKMLEVEEKMRPKLYGTLGGEFAMISQMNSIAQHHFTEIFLGNGTDGGAFSATTARLKLKKEQLCSAFSGGVVPDVVFLECDEEQGKKQGRAKDEDKKKKKGREKTRRMMTRARKRKRMAKKKGNASIQRRSASYASSVSNDRRRDTSRFS